MASKLFRPGYFAGKVNVVTGGGSGIGLGIAEGLVELGSKVVIASRNPERIEEATQLLSSKCQDGGEVLGLQCNIRSRESVKQMVSDTISHFGRLDGLVNNGGGQFHSPAENISANGFHAVVETNLYGTYHCMMEAFEQHMKENGGKIVNIVTINRMGMAGMAHSGAARAGVKNLSMSLGAEWAKYGIIINNVAPGTIHSDTAQANYGPLGEMLFDGAVQTIPMGRLGSTTDDLAPSVIFMLSEEYYIPETDASQYLSYGCNCNLLDSKGLATPGHGAAVDQIDQACKNYKDCQRCVQIEDGSECNLEGPNALYKLGFLSDQPYCMNPVKSCNRHLCECDKQFAEELKQALPFYDSQFSNENHDRSKCQHKPKLSFNSSPRMRPLGIAGDGFNFIGGERASTEMFLHDDDAKCCGPSTGPKKIYHDAVKQCCNPTKKEYFLANIGECPPDWNL